MTAGLKNLRAALAADTARLAGCAGSLVRELEAAGVGGQTLEDATDLARQVGILQAGIDGWFSEDAFQQSGRPLEAFLADSRHAARNVLNKIFGPTQFLEADPACELHLDTLAELSALADHCTGLLVATREMSESEDAAAGVAAAAEPGLILVADDDPENRDILARLLDGQGHLIEFAEDGDEALKKIRASDYDLVLLDIQMPKLDGFGVLESLRESGHLRHTPVIVVTGLQGETDAVRCISIGAEDFLSRPLRQALLVARINASLEKKRLRENVFSQHFPPELARKFARDPDASKMEGKSAEISVLFCDIRQFSAISEKLAPHQTIEWLSGVMESLTECITDNKGVLVNYIGDELLAMWGAPTEQPDHAALACRAALDMLERLPAISAEWEPKIGAETRVGIGVNSGTAHVGNVGTAKLFKYGPLGSVVNVASRVQGATKYLRTPLLATGETCAGLGSKVARRRLCHVRVQNIQEPVELFEIAPPGVEKWNGLRKRYEEALGDFEGARFQRATEVLGNLVGKFQDDGPALLLMSRAVDAMLHPERRFDPVWKLPGK